MQELKEEAYSKIRVFRWNQKLPDNIAPSQSQGLLLFIIKERLTISLASGDKEHQIYTIFPEVNLFELTSLLSKDSIEALARESISRNCKFFLPETNDHLTTEISNYLVSNFSFSFDNLQCPNEPKTVIVVEVYRIRYVNYGVDEDKDQSQSQDEIFYEEDEYIENVDFNTKGILYKLMEAFMVPTSCSIEPIAIDEPFELAQVPPLRMFQLCDGDHASKDTCPICLVEFTRGMDIRKISCSHIFHGACIARWLSKRLTCPMCRFHIL